MTARSGDPLAESQVCPRAVGDCRSGAQQGLQLGIVDVDGVGHEHVGAEHAEVVKMLHRPPPRASHVRRCIGVRRSEVEGEASAGVGGQLAGADSELVGHQVMTDKRHPATHTRVVGRQCEHLALPIEHRGDVTGERKTIAVGSPAAQRASDADPVEGSEDPVGVADRPRLDGERDAVGDGVDEGECRRQLLVIGVVSGVEGNRPVEDRLVRRDRVGDRRTGQPIASEVLMGIDEPWEDEGARPSQPLGRSPARLQVDRRTDVDDAVPASRPRRHRGSSSAPRPSSVPTHPRPSGRPRPSLWAPPRPRSPSVGSGIAIW